MADTAATYSGHIFSVSRRLWRLYESNTKQFLRVQNIHCSLPGAMQGDQTEQSIIHALDRINRHEELFDGVVIIRGGGATSDLNSFDSYPLAVNVAQFPLPVITGIGHERDDTVIDMVANTRVKNPYGGSRMDYRSYARSRHICRQSVAHDQLRSP